jgi:energy-coupling factor transporter ATP-binding protein EcfA2
MTWWAQVWLVPAVIAVSALSLSALSLLEASRSPGSLTITYYYSLAVNTVTAACCGWIGWVWFRRRQDLESSKDLLRTLELPRIPMSAGDSTLAAVRVDNDALYVESIELRNIRCFEFLEIPFIEQSWGALTTLLVGENSSGKSTLLRSLALGLCPESDAVALMRKQGRFVRNGAQRGKITVRVRGADFRGEIHTRIEAGEGSRSEVVRQETIPHDFPWDRIFLCGYGTQRTAEATSSHERYTPLLALSTLFEDSKPLLNPEAVLSRQHAGVREEVNRMLASILMLESDLPITKSPTGLALNGPWGAMPLQGASDGYRSTTQWVLDFLGWQSFAGRLKPSGPGGGLLLIDEIEQHIHPRWQRHLVQRIRQSLPAVQIIATTHTPLIASGAADIEGAKMIQLQRDEGGEVTVSVIAASELTGMRADQVLAGAFGLLTTKNPNSEADTERYVQLLQGERTAEEDREFSELDRRLKGGWQAQNPYEEAVEKALSETLARMAEANSDLLEVEKKRQLREMFERLEKSNDSH